MIQHKLTPAVAASIDGLLTECPWEFAIIDRELIFQYANAPFIQHWSEQSGPVAGKALREVIGDTHFERLIEPVVQATSGNAVSFQCQCERDDRVISYETKLTPYHDGAGEVAGFYVYSRDLTADENSEHQLSLFLETTPSRVYMVDMDYRIRYANQRVYELFDVKEDLKGTPLPDLIGDDLWRLAKKHIDLAMTGQYVSFREHVKSGSLTNQHVQVYITPDKSPGSDVVNGVYCLVTDETELEEAKTRLRQTEHNFDLALRSELVGVWEIDLQRDDWMFTEHIERLLGLRRGELGNSEQEVFKRIHPDDLPAVIQGRDRHLASGEHWVVEFRCLAKSGKYHWLRTVANAEVNETGKPIRLAGTIADINELKSAQIVAASRLESQNAFLSMLSHELRNPVAAIQYAIDLFDRDQNSLLTDAQKTSAGILKRQSTMISRLLKDLLNVSRVSQDQISFEKSNVRLGELLPEILDVARPFVEAKQQRLEFQFDASGAVVHGDRVRLTQAFVNLLDNASKYSDPETKIVVGCHLIDSQCVITISDQGMGINESSIGQVFDLFYQEDQSLSRTAGGLGVGLYLVKKIIDAHDGSVTAHSPGSIGGTELEVRLPVTIDNRTGAPTKGPGWARQTIALVEDNNDSRLALELALKGRGFEVVSFQDGESAIAQLPKLAPKVALMDIGLPGKDGLQAIRELKQHPSLKGTFFVALTGYGQQHEREMTIEAGFNDHFVKPVDIGSLCEAIVHQVGQS